MVERTLPRDDHAPPGIRSWQLWFSMGAEVVVWSLHLLLVYPLTSLTCEWGWFPFEVGGLAGLQVVQLMVTIIAGLVTAAGALFAHRNRQRLDGQDNTMTSRHRFMAELGLALSVLFTALIVIAVVPILTLPICG